MTSDSGGDPDGAWEVVVAEAHDRGDRADGAQESVVMRGPEDEARRVFADHTAAAGDSGYEYVRLRHHGEDVEWWPQATGWTV